MIFILLQTSKERGKKEYISCFVSSAQKNYMLEWTYPFHIPKHVNHGE